MNRALEKIVEELKKDLDPDLVTLISEVHGDHDGKAFYPLWMFIPNPIQTIIEWQNLKNFRKKNKKSQ